MLVSCNQSAGQNWDIKIASRSFENMSQFKYFGITVTNQNLIQKEIKRRLNSGNSCYCSFQNLLSSLLLSKNIKVRISEAIILLVVLYGSVGVCRYARRHPRDYVAKHLKGQFSRSRTGEVVAGLIGSCLRRPGECSQSWSAVLPPR
jgi:hypothetical protein